AGVVQRRPFRQGALASARRCFSTSSIRTLLRPPSTSHPTSSSCYLHPENATRPPSARGPHLRLQSQPCILAPRPPLSTSPTEPAVAAPKSSRAPWDSHFVQPATLTALTDISVSYEESTSRSLPVRDLQSSNPKSPSPLLVVPFPSTTALFASHFGSHSCSRGLSFERSHSCLLRNRMPEVPAAVSTAGRSNGPVLFLEPPLHSSLNLTLLIAVGHPQWQKGLTTKIRCEGCHLLRRGALCMVQGTGGAGLASYVSEPAALPIRKVPPHQRYLCPYSDGCSSLAVLRRLFIWTHSEPPFDSLAAAENLDGTACLIPESSIDYSRIDLHDCQAGDHCFGSRCIGRDTSLSQAQLLTSPVAPSQSSQECHSVICDGKSLPLAFPSRDIT
ncbi:hypothetical protein BKA61DRAFT_249175, partial [Leptodontidium sp. MPI-SDFR-AT-0119]